MPEALDSTVESGEIPIAVRDHGGDGPPVLLLHGAGSSLEALEPLAQRLCADHRVVSMDFRNHGLSGSGSFTWPAVLGDVRTVIDHFALERPALVGHSLGGMVAALYGVEEENLSAVVNLDGHGVGVGADPDDPDEMKVLERIEEIRRELTVNQFSPIPAAAVEAQLNALPADRRELTQKHIDRTMIREGDTFRVRSTPEEVEELLAEVHSLDLFATYRRCKRPLLIFNATAGDPPAGTEGSAAELAEIMVDRRLKIGKALARTAAEVPGVEVDEVEATHWLITEIPDQLAPRISSFILAAA